MAVVVEGSPSQEIIQSATDPTPSPVATEESSVPPRGQRGVKFSVGDALEDVSTPLEATAKLMAPVKRKKCLLLHFILCMYTFIWHI